MIIKNVTNFRKDIYNTLNQVTKYSETAAITTKDGGTAIIINKEDYDAMMETIYCMQIPDLEEDIKDALNSDSKNYVTEDAIKW